MYRIVIMVMLMFAAGCQEAAKKSDYRQNLLEPNRQWRQKYGYKGQLNSQAAYNIALNRVVINKNAEVLNKFQSDIDERLKRLEVKAGFADPNEPAK